MTAVSAAVATLDWWHVIEVAPGVVTPGDWDLRPTAAAMPWPRASLAGMRCLDIGTMDGFWAFECEKRGASEVVATDIRPAREQFRVAAEVLDSGVEYREANVFDLDPREHGEFDLVVMGYVLQMVRDPVGALERVRGICRGHLLLLDTVSLPLSLLPAPLARLNARRRAFEWFVFNRAGLKQAVTMAGFAVEATTPVLRDYAGPGFDASQMPLRDRISRGLGIVGRSAALRARRR